MDSKEYNEKVSHELDNLMYERGINDALHELDGLLQEQKDAGLAGDVLREAIIRIERLTEELWPVS